MATGTNNRVAEAAAEGGALVPVDRPPAGRPGGVVITDFDSLARFAAMVEKSGLAPKGMNAAAVGVAVQMGLELGLSPMQALQSIAVINGRPGLYGDAAKAVVEASGLLADFDEWYELGGKRVEDVPATPADGFAAVCLSRRAGRSAAKITRFSVADAKRAALWSKAGPWTQYPGRMLMFRARGFNLRDNFPDVLRGIKTVEELQDYPLTEGIAPRLPAKAATVGQDHTVDTPAATVSAPVAADQGDAHEG